MKCALILLAVSACERADKDVPRTKQMRIQNPTVTVALREAGREPRRIMRRQPRVGVETYEYRIATTYEWDAGVRNTQPVTTLRQQRAIVEVQGDGAARETWTMLDVSYDRPTDDEALQRYLWMKRARITHWVDARGMVLGDTQGTIDERIRPEDYEPDNSQFTMVLPEEAIGPGARWEIQARAPHASATIAAELLAVDGDLLDIKIEFQHTNRRVTVLQGTGEADLHLDLRGARSRSTYVERGGGTVDGHALRFVVETTGRGVSP